MVLDAMRTVQAEGVTMCDADPDLDVFRQRLGQVLNYEYDEDSQMALFHRRYPREGAWVPQASRAHGIDELL